MALTPIGDLLIALKADVDDFQKASATADDLVSGLRGTFGQLGRVVRNTGAIITGFGAIATAVIGSIAAAGERLNNKFREVGTLFGDISVGAERFGTQIANLSQEFAIQGGQLTALEGLYQVVSAGIEGTSNQMAVLTESTRLAKVGFADIEPVVDTVTTALNAYGRDAQEAGRITDTLFAVVEEGKITLDELSSSIGPVLAFAGPLGASLQQVGAAMATLTAQGVPARRAATALRSTFSKFQKPTSDMKEVLISLARDGMIELTEKQRIAFQEFERQEAQLQELQMEYQSITADIQNLKGEFDELSMSMRENRIAIQEIRVKAQEEGRKLTQQEKDRIEELRNENDKLRLNQMKVRHEMEKKQNVQEDTKEQLDSQKESMKSAKETAGQFASQLGQAVIKQNDLIGALKMVTKRGGEMNKTTASMFRNIRALQFVQPAVNDEFETLQSNFESIQDSGGNVNKMWSEMENTASNEFGRAVNSLKGGIQALGDSFQKALAPILRDVGETFSTLASQFKALPKSVKENIAQFAVLATSLALVVGPMMLLIGQATLMVSALGVGGLLGVVGSLAFVFGVLGGRFQEISGDAEAGDEALSNLADTLKDLMDSAKAFGRMVKEELLPGFITFASGVTNSISALIDGFRNSVSEGDEFSESIHRIVSAMGDVFMGIGKWLSQNSDLFAAVGSVAGKLSNALLPPIVDLAIAIGDVVGDVVNLVTALLASKQAKAVLAGIIGSIIGVTEAIGVVVQTISTFVSNNSDLISKIIVAATAFAGFIATVAEVSAAITAMSATISGLIGSSTVMVTVAALISAGISSIISTVVGLIPFLSTLSTGFTIVASMVGTLSTVLGTIVAILGGPITIAIIAIIGLITLWKTNLFGFRDVVMSVFNGFVGFISDAVNAVQNFFQKNKKFFSALAGILLVIFTGGLALPFLLFKNNVGGMRDKVEKVVGQVASFFKGLVKPVKGAIMTIVAAHLALITAIGDVLVAVGSFVADILVALGDAVIGIGEKIYDTVIKPIEQPFLDFIDNAAEWGSNLIDDFVQGMKDQIPNVVDGLKGIGTKIEKYIGIFSDADAGPLSNLTQWGPNLIKTFAKSIKDGQGTVKEAIMGLTSVPNLGIGASMSGLGGAGLIIQRGAVLFEEGAFAGQDLDEREVARLVRQELEGIVDSLESRGRGA